MEREIMPLHFWHLLGKYSQPNVFNPWRDYDPDDASPLPVADRLRRLSAHLDCDAEYMLVGEAPGHKGCHFSGVPFTCEWQYFDNRIAGPFAGKRITKYEKPLREASATVVYRVMDELEITDKVVMWNAFPFHPHHPGDRLSNRTPKPREVADGMGLLTIMRRQFPKAKVIAVGQIAKRLLDNLYIPAVCVRHPSMGGSTQFREEMIELTKRG